MDFHISEESRKKLDDMIYGHVKRQQEMDEQKKQEEKRKRLEHLETYHFKTVEDLINHLKTTGRRVYWDGNTDHWTHEQYQLIYLPVENKIKGYSYPDMESEETNVKYMTEEEFKEIFFFSLQPGSTGYIDKWHKEN